MNRLTVEECERLSVSQLVFNSPVFTVQINTQNVLINQTKCNYGGTRKWFICPNCNRRVGTLYRKPVSSHFYCRNCQNLTYQLRKYHRSPHEQFIKQLKNLSFN